MGCQPARDEPATNPTKRLPRSPCPPFSARVPDLIRMHKRTTRNDSSPLPAPRRNQHPDSIRMHKRTPENDYPPPPTEVIYTSPSNLSSGRKFGECCSFPFYGRTCRGGSI
ncbi:hypothetical protein CEXT_772821 [Caerostris extrusa]|uniref:Uncharacterized protein n=1 Tax=Caerostris extrusa TaxID=172846 RepID=A0AAV4UEP8_CAEEX|nr:hypothetical protein CEXT_772821 [Caerostris extrusa]